MPAERTEPGRTGAVDLEAIRERLAYMRANTNHTYSGGTLGAILEQDVPCLLSELAVLRAELADYKAGADEEAHAGDEARADLAQARAELDALKHEHSQHHGFCSATPAVCSHEVEATRLREWRNAVSSAIKCAPWFEKGEWGGDKEGWGYHLEMVGFLIREIERLQAIALRVIPDKEAHQQCEPADCGFRRALDEIAGPAEARGAWR